MGVNRRQHDSGFKAKVALEAIQTRKNDCAIIGQVWHSCQHDNEMEETPADRAADHFFKKI